MVEDYKSRARPRSDPSYRDLDDKWMFTRTYFERLRAEQGWSELITYALNVSTRRDCATRCSSTCDSARASTEDALPAWAWSVIDETDASVSDDLRRELAQEGAVLLRKPLR